MKRVTWKHITRIFFRIKRVEDGREVEHKQHINLNFNMIPRIRPLLSVG